LKYDIPVSLEQEAPEDKIAYFGRITEQTKRVVTLAKICEENAIRLDLYGSIEPEAKEWSSLILSDYKYVKYGGQLKQSDVQDMMSRYKATITFSECEVFGNVVSRSLQLGVPCVVNGDCEGTTEILGLLGCEAEEFIAKRSKKRMMYKDWSEAIVSAVSKALSLDYIGRKRLQERAYEMLSYNKVGRSLLNFYERAV
jgi:glycosyltransferase involved in cell wall biosynthesis